MNLTFELKNFAKSFLRSGRRFHGLHEQVQRCARLSGDELAQWQFLHLKQTLASAYSNVPFYRDHFDRHQMHPDDIRSLEDVAKIPVTEKSDLRARNRDFLNTRHWGPKFTVHTSGSTGSPLVLRRDVASINMEHAFVWRFWREGGKPFGSRRVTVGAQLISSVQKQDTLWVYNRFQHELMASAFHLSEQGMQRIFAKLADFAAYDLMLLPSVGYSLAEFAHRTHQKLNFGAVFTSSEELFPHQRTLMEQQFQTRVWDWYGQSERVTAIAQCSHGKYHVQEDYGWTEMLPLGGDLYEIVGTSFFNHLMPLIRYRTGDRVRLRPGCTCGCGSAFRVVEAIEGRQSSYILTPDGRKVSMVYHIPREVPYLIEAQFVQESPSDICIRAVVDDRFAPKDAELLIKRAKDRLSPDLRFRIEKMSSIPRTSGGKFLSIIPLSVSERAPLLS